MRNFILKYTDNDDGLTLYQNDSLTIKSGVTVLVGCNGSGKTSLMNQLSEILDDLNISNMKYYSKANSDKVSGQFGIYGSGKDGEYLKSWFQQTYSSEGESLFNTFVNLSKTLGSFVSESKDEAWIFIDSIDSGMSIDLIIEIKDFLQFVIQTKPDDLDLHIVIAANVFELVTGFDCIDIQTFEHTSFIDYEDYKDYVVNSRRIKDKLQRR